MDFTSDLTQTDLDLLFPFDFLDIPRDEEEPYNTSITGLLMLPALVVEQHSDEFIDFFDFPVEIDPVMNALQLRAVVDEQVARPDGGDASPTPNHSSTVPLNTPVESQSPPHLSPIPANLSDAPGQNVATHPKRPRYHFLIVISRR
jgi:hypothetical protein